MRNQAEVVLHDGAPNVGGGGAWAKDAFNQAELTLHAFKVRSRVPKLHQPASYAIIFAACQRVLGCGWMVGHENLPQSGLQFASLGLSAVLPEG